MYTEYADSEDRSYGEYDVVFLNKDGKKLVRHFASPYIASKFVRKIRRNRKCQLISYPSLQEKIMAVVRKEQIIREISIEEFLQINQTEEIIEAFLRKITKNLADGNSVVLTGFGKFETYEMQERRSNLNGKEIIIPKRIYPKFTPGSALKREVVKEL